MRRDDPRVEVEVHAEALVHPSEDPLRVVAAVQNLLPHAEVQFEAERSRVSARASLTSLRALYEAVRNRRTLGVLRRLLLRNASDGETWLLLHKQAAYAHVLVLCEAEEESPLGPIRIVFRTRHLQELIDWLAPRT